MISLSVTTYAQVDSIRIDLIPISIDSIQLSIWEVHTKEGSMPDQEEEYEKELERVVLSDNDQQVLITKFRDPKSYDQTRALPYHFRCENNTFTIR